MLGPRLAALPSELISKILNEVRRSQAARTIQRIARGIQNPRGFGLFYPVAPRMFQRRRGLLRLRGANTAVSGYGLYNQWD